MYRLTKRTIKLFYYDESYKYYKSIDASNAGTVRIKRNQTNTGNENKAKEISKKTNSESTCVEMGVYVVTYNEFGVELYRQLLYTYYRGDCPLQATEIIAPAYGGEDEEMAAIQAEFDAYVQEKVLMNGDNIYCIPNPDEHHYYYQVIKWSIASQIFGAWSVNTHTDITYSRSRVVVNANTIQTEFIYDISSFNTADAVFEGSSIVASSVFYQKGKKASIHYNHTSQAKGMTEISGVISHVSKREVQPKYGGDPWKPTSGSNVLRNVNIIPR